MKSIEITKEGYWGIPATEKVFTEDELIQFAQTQDAGLIPYVIAELKKAKEITITAVAVKDGNGNSPTTVDTAHVFEVPIGDTITLVATHTPAESTKATTWANGSTTYLTMVVDPDDPRIVHVTHKASGSSTITATVGSTSYVVTISNPS